MQVNRNNIWSKIIISTLQNTGVTNAVVCPGSRNTPLLFALDEQSKINKYIIVDERSAAFFALGLAKHSGTPTLVITTSGTAVAELYPAIIEAYFTRTPLIICTADRPEYIRGCGANQTIFQEGIFKNHIRDELNLDLPKLEVESINDLSSSLTKIINTSVLDNPGPVHINVPFEKPLEPNLFTDEISSELLNQFYNYYSSSERISKPQKEKFDISEIRNKNLVFYTGGNNYSNQFYNKLVHLCEKSNSLIIPDGTCKLRFSKHPNVISNITSLLKSEKFSKYLRPDYIIQFGSAPTSAILNNFFEKTSAQLILVNKDGDELNPYGTKHKLIHKNADIFLNEITEELLNDLQDEDKKYNSEIKRLNNSAEIIKQNHLNKLSEIVESNIVNSVLNNIDSPINLFIGNSTAIRDFDFFVNQSEVEHNVFHNRGASGIDGINSTAIGVATSSKEKTILVTGDLSFYHDLNGLYASQYLSNTFIIILINNNGGGIFEMLPVAEHKSVHEKYVRTPLNIEYKHFADAYKFEYHTPQSQQDIIDTIKNIIDTKSKHIIELKTDSKKSHLVRKEIWQKITEMIDEEL